jgi:aspartyl-tRNA(Asn)/glutamyl-tRNA(Gln) amidotransferase subunit C
MSVTKDEILITAKLAKLSFSETELEGIQNDMNRIIEYFDVLNEADTSDIELKDNITGVNFFRKDEMRESLSNSDAMKNSPQSKNGFFKVPEVVIK